MSELKTKSVDAVVRALQILKSFDTNAKDMSLADICRRTGIVKSTTLRMLLSLAEEGMVTITPDRRYALGPELYRLGKRYADNVEFEDHIRPVMKELVTSTQECVSFFQRVGNKRMCLFREDSDQLLREHVAEGDTVSLDKGAAGRVLTHFTKHDAMVPGPAKTLESLPFVSIGERDSEIGGIAAPVFSNVAGLVGAMTISAPLTRLTESRIAALQPLVYAAAARVSKVLGARFYG